METKHTSSSLSDKLLSPSTSRGDDEIRGQRREEQAPNISKESGRSWLGTVEKAEPGCPRSGQCPPRGMRWGNWGERTVSPLPVVSSEVTTGPLSFSLGREDDQRLVTMSLSFVCCPDFYWSRSKGDCFCHSKLASPWMRPSPSQASLFPGLNGTVRFHWLQLLLEASPALAFPFPPPPPKKTKTHALVYIQEKQEEAETQVMKMTCHLLGTVTPQRKISAKIMPRSESSEPNSWQSLS